MLTTYLAKQLAVYSLLISLISYVNSTDIICTPETECSVDICSTQYACKNFNIYCSNQHNCTINCDGFNACLSTNIYCPDNASCTINCGMNSAKETSNTCKGTTIFALNSSKLNINLGANRAMYSANIICPNDGIHDYSTPKLSYPCQISITADISNSLESATIDAVEGLHDININCSGTPNSCLNGNEIIQCTEDSSSSCVLASISTCAEIENSTDIEAQDCGTYVLTSSPTNVPTIEPTNAPTVLDFNIYFCF